MIVYHIKFKKQNLNYIEKFSCLTYFNCFGIFKMKFMIFLVITKMCQIHFYYTYYMLKHIYSNGGFYEYNKI